MYCLQLYCRNAIHGWVGHIARFKDNVWTKIVTEWTPRELIKGGREDLKKDGETTSSATRVLRGQE